MDSRLAVVLAAGIPPGGPADQHAANQGSADQDFTNQGSADQDFTNQGSADQDRTDVTLH